MSGNCLDIGTIQSFLDRELEHAGAAEVSSHIAACDACALMLAEAEEESAFVFPVLEREMNTLVPTQRLWNKINDSLETQRQNRPFWEKAWAFVSVAFVSPSFSAAAGLLIVAGLFAFIWSSRDSAPAETAGNNPPVAVPAINPVNASEPSVFPVTSKDDPEQIRSFRPEMAVSRPANLQRSRLAPLSSAPTSGSAVAVNAVYMPGEESYIKTISSLSKIVDTQKDTAMRPSQRVAYERDMAVVDDAISKMKQEVRKDPKNESAKQVLYSSYQNKIDLLNSVSRKEELIASLR